MERRLCKPRDNYQQIIEQQGFGFHHNYWFEDAYYAFSNQEIATIREATKQCYDMYCEATEQCLYDEQKLDALHIPYEIRDTIRRSWEEDDLSLYGRFDFMLVNGIPKLLEFNADTPTSLVESAVIQWWWSHDVFPQNEQFNDIHDALVESWRDIHAQYKCDKYFFASISDCLEDNSTLAYLISTAQEAGLLPYELDIRCITHQNYSLYAPDGIPINCMFKLYPWETMFKENIYGCMTEMCWIEPLWKSLMSNKAMLPILYQMFPNSPYILPAYTEIGKLSSYCKKPIFSREGANVELVKQGDILETSGGEYGEEGYIYQQLVEQSQYFDGYCPILGSWVVGGEPCGLGIRESKSKITQDTSRFVPHLIV